MSSTAMCRKWLHPVRFSESTRMSHTSDTCCTFHPFHLYYTFLSVPLVQALRLCTGRTAHRGSRGIALLFHDQRHQKGGEE